MEFTVTLEDWEVNALKTDILGIDVWTNQVIKDRARRTGDKIIEKLLRHCNTNSIALAVGKEAQISQALELGIAVNLEDYED